MNEFWKRSARLWRRGNGGGALAITQVDSGSLEAMVRAAVERGQPDLDEGASLFVDVEAEQMLSWSEIKRLRHSPEFPIEI